MNMVVREGYKQTEVGMMPEDWHVMPLEHYTSFISYGFTNPMPTVAAGISMVTAKDINFGKIQFSTTRFTTDYAYKTLLSDKSRPRKGDVLLTKDGTLGRLAVVGDEKICINQSVAILRPNELIDPLFFKILLESPTYQRRMLDDAGGSTIKHIYITIVNRMPLACPADIVEQKKIADVISDIDALITHLDQLIAKKRDIQQAAMQQLLTGQRRLPGFSGEWEVKRLGELAKIQRGASPRPIDSPHWFDESSTVGWVRISDVTNSGMYLESTTQRLSPAGVARSRPRSKWQSHYEHLRHCWTSCNYENRRLHSRRLCCV